MNIFPARCFSRDGSPVGPRRKNALLSRVGLSRFGCGLIVAAFCGQMFSAPAFGAHPNPVAHPFATIPVQPLGYRPIGSVYMLLRLSSLSLDFIDDTHLLFTFHYSRLISRETERDHDDQIIRAMVLEVPSGKVEATTEWRMHDRQRYLFPLGGGEFLVRQGQEISRMGRDLVLHPYIHSVHHVEAAQISPDGRILTIQSDLERHSEEKHKQLVAEAIANGENLPDEDISVEMVALDHREVMERDKSDGPVKLAVTGTGYVDHEQGPSGNWKLLFHPFDGKEKAFGEVQSSCTPSEDFINADTLMLILCRYDSSDRIVTALTTDGKQAWKGEWDGRFIGPNFAVSGEGRNFAVNWIVATHPVDAMFSLSDGEVAGQAVEVLSTTTGHLLLSVNASPVVSAGQNFALSADGHRLAVLNKGNIELYEVPADKAK